MKLGMVNRVFTSYDLPNRSEDFLSFVPESINIWRTFHDFPFQSGFDKLMDKCTPFAGLLSQVFCIRAIALFPLIEALALLCWHGGL
jgi:hypothetical protein